MAKIDEFEDFHPLSRGAWRDWLAKNHESSPGVWFVYFKKSTGKPRVSYDEAVEEALCFGWIDSVPRFLDEERSKLLFTPRKPRSVWSKLNKARVERLIAAKLMTESGLAKIEAAKRDGSWNTLDASDQLEIPPDLAREFKKSKTAAENFEAFTDSSKKMILQWLGAAKQAETRAKRIAEIIDAASENRKPAQFERKKKNL